MKMLLFTGFFSLLTTSVFGQELVDKINPDLLTVRWTAQWIQHPASDPAAYGVFHFRKSFQLSEVPDEFIINVSADNRYRLYVNGTEMGFGPARGDQLHWYFETYDISSFLRKGDNVIAALVWNMGGQRPLSQITYQTAFILQGNSDREAIVNTNNSWVVEESEAFNPIMVDGSMVKGYYAVGGMDEVEGGKYLWGWQEIGFDDSSWRKSGNIGYGGQGAPYGYDRYTATSAWQLIPRDIPMMEEREERITNIVRTEGESVNNDFLTGKGKLTIRANSHLKILLDLSYLTTAYPTLITSEGKGSEIKVTYAEALYGKEGKGNRNEIEGKDMFGLYDKFRPGGNQKEVYKPLWYRTYRFVELEITTGENPLSILDFYGTFTAYPFQNTGFFESGSNTLDQIWDIGWRTARLCAMETYVDCPYYEQLQYIGDTRIQALISLYVSGDDRLMKKAIRQFDQSRFYEGLTMSRHPTYIPQVTPPYSLIQVLMVHDFMMYRDDKEFVKEMAPGIESILGWFERRVDETGLTGLLNWVNYMDAAKGFESGTPPYRHEGHSAQISFLYAYAAKHAADIFKYLDEPAKASFYENTYYSLINNVYEQCYDTKRGLFAETPAKKYYTQHTNILAILTDAIPEQEQRPLMQKILNDTTLTQVEIYFQFYLFEALKKTGLADQYMDLLDDWYTMIGQGLTTFSEHRDQARSDCHAWSSHPIHGFLATVTGIRSVSPGFREIEIRPALGQLEVIHSVVPHPDGVIDVEIRKSGEGLTGSVTLPANTKGNFTWNNRNIPLKPGTQKIQIK